MNKLITLLGALTLMASVSGRADVRADIFNQLDNNDGYQSLSSDEQAVLDNAIDKAVSNFEEQGMTLNEGNSQMFLEFITKLLGLSKGKEDKKPAPAMTEETPMPASTSNNAEDNLALMDANGTYFLEIVKDIVNKVVDGAKSVLGLGSKPAPTTPAPTSIFNSANEDVSLQDAVQYGAITDALKQLGSVLADKFVKGADKVKDFLGGKKPAEEPMPNPEATAENTMAAGLSLEDTTAQYGAVLDALRNLGGVIVDKAVDKAKDLGSKLAGAVGSVAEKVGGMLKDKPAEMPVE